jgi:5-methylcytosine-specific restriction endonuclease McrA
MRERAPPIEGEGSGHCLKEKRRVPVRHVAYSNGTEAWICLSCGSHKVRAIVEGTLLPALIKSDTCHYCGQYFDPTDKHLRPTRDHIIPRAKGGPDAAWNECRACARCNTKKKDDWPTCPCIKCRTATKIFLLVGAVTATSNARE